MTKSRLPHELAMQKENWLPWAKRQLSKYRHEYSFKNPPSDAKQSIRNNRTGETFEFIIRNAIDLDVLRQIYSRLDYDILQLRRGAEVVELYERIVRNGEVPLIVDCGANIGASVRYFHEKFPHAQVFAIEPDSNNFECLTRHCTSPQIRCIRAAVSSSRGLGSIANPESEPWAFQVQAGESGDINFQTIADLLGEAGPGFVPFIIKIDIEGFEKDLFAQNTEWVQKFPLLIIELHDWMLPRQGTSHNFLKIIASLDRDFVYLNENIFSLSNNI